MIFFEELVGDVVVLTVNLERATIKNADEFKHRLVSIINKGYNKIVIDVSSCTFIDSSFLGVLVSILKRVVRLNGDLKLVGFQPAVRSMFELTRMFRVFDTFSNKDEAVNSFK